MIQDSKIGCDTLNINTMWIDEIKAGLPNVPTAVKRKKKKHQCKFGPIDPVSLVVFAPSLIIDKFTLRLDYWMHHSMTPTPEDPYMMLIEAEIDTEGDGGIDDKLMNTSQTPTTLLDCRHMLENLECESGIFSRSDLAICPRVDLSKCRYSIYDQSITNCLRNALSYLLSLLVEFNLSDRLLSRGAFHSIFQKSSAELSIYTVDSFDNVQSTDESITSSSSSLRSEKVFAIKRLREDLVQNNLVRKGHCELVRKGHCELVKEAKLLANLSDRNIISLIGVSGDLCSHKFSLLLDKLQSSFSDVYIKWKGLDKITRTKLSGKKEVIEAQLNQQLNSRIGVGCDLASALKYLHSKR